MHREHDHGCNQARGVANTPTKRDPRSSGPYSQSIADTSKPKHHGHQCDGRSELGNRQDTASTISITRQPHPGSVPFDMDRMPGCPPDTLPASMWRRHTHTAIRWDRSRPTTIPGPSRLHRRQAAGHPRGAKPHIYLESERLAWPISKIWFRGQLLYKATPPNTGANGSAR